MDDVSGNESISELFAHNYNVLYNSVCSATTQLNDLLALNENDIITLCSKNNTSLTKDKDKRCSKRGSNNYSAIAISGILGILFDSIIIKDYTVFKFRN